jgi:hypothetical protein
LQTRDHAGLPYSTVYYSPAGSGGSLSVLIGYSDGVKRATKLMGNPQQNIVLGNELIVARLAELSGAPCPRGARVFVNQSIVEAAKREIPGLESARQGVCFGSEWMEAAQYGPGEAICLAAANRPAIAGLIVLYTWTRNTDLKDHHLLWRTLPDGTHEVYGVDHGHCFDYQWDASICARIADVRLRTLPQLTAAARGEEVALFINRVQSLSRGDLKEATTDVPPEWGISAEALTGLVDYLDQSRTKLSEVVSQAFSSQR